jgi:hypothetical protein
MRTVFRFEHPANIKSGRINKLSGRSTDVKFTQFQNIPIPIFDTLDGIDIWTKEEHPLNTSESNDLTPKFIITCVRFLQLTKARFPIDLIELGIVTLINFVLANAYSLMETTLEGILIFSNEEYANVYSSMETTLDGRFIVSKEEYANA